MYKKWNFQLEIETGFESKLVGKWYFFTVKKSVRQERKIVVFFSSLCVALSVIWIPESIQKQVQLHILIKSALVKFMEKMYQVQAIEQKMTSYNLLYHEKNSEEILGSVFVFLI